MAEEVNIEVNQTTQEVNIAVTQGGGLGTVTSVAITGTDGIQVDSGSPIITSGTIVLGLSSTVLSQLSLAASSVQPGDNITDLTNNAGYITGVDWGDIGGSLSSQVDLQSALDGKISSVQAGANVSIDNTDPQNPVISATGMGTGTVTSVGLSASSSLFSVTGSPVTSSGTLDLDLISQSANQVFAGPDSGSPDIPTFRSLVVDDIPDLSGLYATAASLLDYLEIDQNLADLDDVSAARTNLGLQIGVNVQAYDAGLQSISGLTTAANNGIYTTASDTYATYSLTAGGRALGGAAGTANTIPYFSASNTVSLLTTTTGGRALLNNAGTANTFPYYSASNTVSLSSVTAFGRSLIDDADAATARATLGAIGGSTGSTDNALLRADGSGGFTTQGSLVTVDDFGNMNVAGGFSTSSIAFGFNGDLSAPAARVLVFAQGTSPTMLQFANTYTSFNNKEVAVMDWQTTTNVLRIGSDVGSGGGTARDVQIIRGGAVQMEFEGSGVIDLPATTATAEAVVSDATIPIKIGGVTYKILLKA